MSPDLCFCFFFFIFRPTPGFRRSAARGGVQRGALGHDRGRARHGPRQHHPHPHGGVHAYLAPKRLSAQALSALNHVQAATNSMVPVIFLSVQELVLHRISVVVRSWFGVSELVRGTSLTSFPEPALSPCDLGAP